MISPVQFLVSDVHVGTNRVVKQVSVMGTLDETNVDTEVKKVYALIEELPEGGSLILDLEGLDFLNSKAIGYLSDWYTKILGKSGKLVVARPRENVYDILNVVGLTQVIRFTMTLDEAKLELMD